MSRERPWHVRRSGVPTATGQQRWDRAYQLDTSKYRFDGSFWKGAVGV